MKPTTEQIVSIIRVEHALGALTRALDSARFQANHYRNSGTGWTCDLETANYYEGREAALVFALNLLDGYKADR